MTNEMVKKYIVIVITAVFPANTTAKRMITVVKPW